MRRAVRPYSLLYGRTYVRSELVGERLEHLGKEGEGESAALAVLDAVIARMRRFIGP